MYNEIVRPTNSSFVFHSHSDQSTFGHFLRCPRFLQFSVDGEESKSTGHDHGCGRRDTGTCWDRAGHENICGFGVRRIRISGRWREVVVEYTLSKMHKRICHQDTSGRRAYVVSSLDITLPSQFSCINIQMPVTLQVHILVLFLLLLLLVSDTFSAAPEHGGKALWGILWQEVVGVNVTGIS